MSGQHRPACDRPVCRAYRVAIPVCRPIVIKSFGKDAAFPGTACPNERWMSVSRPQGGRMKRLLIALVLVGACGTSEEQANQSRSEEHTSELQSLMRISYAVFCLKKKNTLNNKISKQPYK